MTNADFCLQAFVDINSDGSACAPAFPWALKSAKKSRNNGITSWYIESRFEFGEILTKCGPDCAFVGVAREFSNVSMADRVDNPRVGVMCLQKLYYLAMSPPLQLYFHAFCCCIWSSYTKIN